MKFILYLLLTVLIVTVSDSSLYNNWKRSFLSYLNPRKDVSESSVSTSGEKVTKNWWRKWNPSYSREVDQNMMYEADVQAAKNKSRILKRKKTAVGRMNSLSFRNNRPKVGKQFYQMDPVLNVLSNHVNYRRKSGSTSSLSQSSSREIKNFKEEFHELWLHKKFEALNQTLARGDQVNMVAARPWGVSCGDPSQHDMPWGSCMLPVECEPEYRIYRGDLFCGRTQFICCALVLTNYDMYQGFDITFEGKSLSTDSDEKRNKKLSSREKRKKKKDKEKKKRRKAREQRKKKIKRHIKKIIREIRKILNRQYRNGTKMRRKRTKQLKKFIKDLKKQYKKDRQSVKDLHEEEMIKIDNNLQSRLLEIKSMNTNFMKNTTFREILVNGTITKKAARMLLEAYPELTEVLEARRIGTDTRRHGNDYLEYDIEYGYLYY